MLTEKLYSPIVKFKFYFGAITENKVTGKNHFCCKIWAAISTNNVEARYIHIWVFIRLNLIVNCKIH